MGMDWRPNQAGEAGGPRLEPADLCGSYGGLKPAATPKGNDGDSDSSSQNDECESQNDAPWGCDEWAPRFVAGIRSGFLRFAAE